MLNAVIVDDEPLAHDVLLHHLASHKDVKVIGQCFNATEALALLARQPVDLLFLDIQMPALTGIELLKVLANKPQVILVTAFKEYAVEGFDLDVTDYLLKPVSADRLSQALNKVKERNKHFHQEVETKVMPASPPHIALKVDRGKQKFVVDDIDYIEAYGNYVKVWQSHNVTLVSSTLKSLMSELTSAHFVQIHKSFAVNRCKVKSVGVDKVTLLNGVDVRVGKSFKGIASQLI
ncbi:LytR/AlgR family response regulator transcription factor [Alteromonas facilis]|uniref:LytR/AlgR family response regulator transcription factor n=1 Tax=Alteromonas facilis TaxID=2048004 RepID=UPI000C28DD3D|nr:response regulator transcription factor [Alteromonas facilis]